MSLPWYPFYPGDYASDTSDLSCCEHGCYRLLLDAFWSRGPLPDDLNRLQRLSANCDAETVRFILERYWDRTEHGWVNAKMEEIRKEQLSKHQRRVNAGRRGGFQKSENKGVSSNARAMLEQCSSNQNQNHNQKEDISAKADILAGADAPAETVIDQRFAEFWNLYPKKTAKKEARKAWGSLRKAQQLDAIEHIKGKPFADREPRFIPHPSTYLRGERWEDQSTTQPSRSCVPFI